MKVLNYDFEEECDCIAQKYRALLSVDPKRNYKILTPVTCRTFDLSIPTASISRLSNKRVVTVPSFARVRFARGRVSVPDSGEGARKCG